MAAGTDIAGMGMAVGLVIAALTYFISTKTRKKSAAAKPTTEA